MSVNEKMTAIADAIRAKTGSADTLTLDGMAAAIPNVFAAGRAAGDAECAAKHFVGTMYGSGTRSMTFNIPFYPDTVLIAAVNPRALSAGHIISFNCNVRGIGHYLGLSLHMNSEGAVTYSSTTIARLASTVSYSDEGGQLVVTLPDGVGAVFHGDMPYVILAEKHETRTDKEIITDFVTHLDAESGGSVRLSQAKVNAAFTDEEWATLIAAKPNWTFTLA